MDREPSLQLPEAEGGSPRRPARPAQSGCARRAALAAKIPPEGNHGSAPAVPSHRPGPGRSDLAPDGVGAVAHALGVSVWWVHKRSREDPAFPKPDKSIRGSTVFFLRSDVERYLKAWPGSRNRRRQQAEGAGPWVTASAAAEQMRVGIHRVHQLSIEDPNFPPRFYLENKPVFSPAALNAYLEAPR